MDKQMDTQIDTQTDTQISKVRDRDKGQPVDLRRRGFLRAAGGAGALGALAAAAGQAAAPVAAPVAVEPAAYVGYHETEHIRQYYRSARYW